MKKISTIILSTALAIAAGQAAAQSVVEATAMGVTQGAVQAANHALVTAATAAPAPAPATAPAAMPPVKPVPLVVKDFAAARSLELERTKFHLGAIEKFRKCVEGAKVSADLTSCQSAYRTALTANVASLRKQGKFGAAYEAAAQPISLVKPAAGPGK